MELMLGALVVALAVGFVALPLVRPRPDPDGSGLERADVAGGSSERYAVYREMLDLDFDHRVGKLDDDDYRELSEACLARAAELLARDDARQAEAAERAEREIAAMRQALRESQVARTPE